MSKRIFHTFETILSSFECDRDCPFCTAKTTKWDCKNQTNIWDTEQLDKLPIVLETMKKQNIQFNTAVITGNGEPCLYPNDVLEYLADLYLKFSDVFERKSILTSGLLYGQDDKFEIFHKRGFTFQTTRTYLDSQKDMECLKYDFDYINSPNFAKVPVRLNYVILKDNVKNIVEDLKILFNKYPNIQTLAPKLLNVNTKDGNANNKYSQWILKHGVEIKKSTVFEIMKTLSKGFNKPLYAGKYFTERSKIDINENQIITFNTKLNRIYGNSNMVFYKGKVTSYKLNELNLKTIQPFHCMD